MDRREFDLLEITPHFVMRLRQRAPHLIGPDNEVNVRMLAAMMMMSVEVTRPWVTRVEQARSRFFFFKGKPGPWLIFVVRGGRLLTAYHYHGSWLNKHHRRQANEGQG